MLICLTSTYLYFRIPFQSTKYEEINFYKDFFYYLWSGQCEGGVYDIRLATLYFKFQIQRFLVTPFLLGDV